MGELLVLALLYGGGFVAAALFMFLATWLRRRLPALVILFCLSLFSLFVQGSCYRVASGIGQATSGTGGNISGPMAVVGLSFLGCIVWATLLFASRRSAEPGDEGNR